MHTFLYVFTGLDVNFFLLARRASAENFYLPENDFYLPVNQIETCLLKSREKTNQKLKL